MATKKTAEKKTELPTEKGRGKPWSDEELRASVEAYLAMSHKTQTKEKVHEK